MSPLFAYFGPETVLPATSIIATVVGVVLMMGKNSIRWCIGSAARVLGRAPKSAVPAPHVSTKARARAVEEAAGR